VTNKYTVAKTALVTP